ncbi:hypothetical protein [Catenulispora pinisilvae]|nr:hypothetical protein [Catenulispora pinisilvae]
MKRKIIFALIGTLAALTAVAVTGAGQQPGTSSPASTHEDLNPGD